MTTTAAIYRFVSSRLGHATFTAVFLSLATAAVVALFVDVHQMPADVGRHHVPDLMGDVDSRSPSATVADTDSTRTLIRLDNKNRDALDLQIAPVQQGQWPREITVTGRIELNASKVAHVSALVAGVVREICVEMGQRVKAGEVLVYLNSREAGQAKLQLAQNQSALKSAQQTNKWYETIHRNTLDLLAAVKDGQDVDAIEQQFHNRPIGNYRQQLVSALAQRNHASADYIRVRKLSADSVLPGKALIRAQAEFESSNAAYQALLEQVRFDSERDLLFSSQKLKEAETALAIGRSQLFVLGLSAQDIADMDPIAEGERVAYYPVRAPHDGYVIERHAALSKHVDAGAELVEIADLSTVWLRADIFEKDLGGTRGLQGKRVAFRTTSYPDEVFSAKVFSLGNVVDDRTRAARLLALVKNANGFLKPGMFAEIDLNSGYDSEVTLVPASAVQRHDGVTFAFVHQGDQQFERRDLQVGRSSPESVEIVDGLAPDELVVVRGGFALKSEMLSELMVEE